MTKSDIPETFTAEYYDQKYFADSVGKTYRNANGSLEHWGYRNESGESSGCEPIVQAWKKIFQCQTMLDVGAGRGTLVAYARQAGVEAYGFDFSEWAVNKGRYAKCKPEWLKVHDATKPWPYPDQNFDLTVSLDLTEHIYLDDLPFVISELHRVSKKWIFLQTAIAGSGGTQGRDEQGYILKKGEPVPIQYEGCAAAGHVTLVKSNVWESWLEHDDWMPRKDMVNWFISLVDASVIRNWLLNLIMIWERI